LEERRERCRIRVSFDEGDVVEEEALVALAVGAWNRGETADPADDDALRDIAPAMDAAAANKTLALSSETAA